MVIKNQNFDSINWMVNFKKVHNYINSDKFVVDLLYNHYNFDKENNYIYVDLERGVVVDRAIPGSTLKNRKNYLWKYFTTWYDESAIYRIYRRNQRAFQQIL